MVRGPKNCDPPALSQQTGFSKSHHIIKKNHFNIYKDASASLVCTLYMNKSILYFFITIKSD